MNDIFNSSNNFSLNNLLPDCENLDINALLVIILILTGKLRIESITVFPNDFTVTLGTFRIV